MSVKRDRLRPAGQQTCRGPYVCSVFWAGVVARGPDFADPWIRQTGEVAVTKTSLKLL